MTPQEDYDKCVAELREAEEQWRVADQELARANARLSRARREMSIVWEMRKFKAITPSG